MLLLSLLVLLGSLRLRLLEHLSLRRMLGMILLKSRRLIQLVLWLILPCFLIRGQRLDVLGAFVLPRSAGSTAFLSRVSSAGTSLPRPSRLGEQLGLLSVDVLVVLLPLSLALRVCCYSINPFV